jgi:isoquinoline 1-oxidoreductase
VADKREPKRGVSYGTLVKGKRIERHLDRKPPLKPISDFTVSGKSTGRTDAVDKVTGKAKFAADISLPGMLYARIVRPPAHGAELIDADTSTAEKVPGAQIVKDGDLIAVVHSSPDQAEKALNLIEANFSRPQTKLNDSNIFEHLMTSAPPGKPVAESGDLGQGRELASKVIEATYRQGSAMLPSRPMLPWPT